MYSLAVINMKKRQILDDDHTMVKQLKEYLLRKLVTIIFSKKFCLNAFIFIKD